MGGHVPVVVDNREEESKMAFELFQNDLKLTKTLDMSCLC